MANEKNKFVVDLGSMELAEDDRQRIAVAIQGAVLSCLAVHRAVPDRQLRLIYDEKSAGMDPGGRH